MSGYQLIYLCAKIFSIFIVSTEMNSSLEHLDVDRQDTLIYYRLQLNNMRYDINTGCPHSQRKNFGYLSGILKKIRVYLGYIEKISGMLSISS